MAAFSYLLNSLRPTRPLATASGGTADSPARRPRIGIAFSSGGAKGLAHIGVIQVLEENGIEVDVVAGTSMGAYVGGLWAAGLSGKELEALAAEMTGKRDLWRLVDPVFPPRRGFIRGGHIQSRLEKTLEGIRFEELKKPFLAVATELETLERVVFKEGDVTSAITASLAVPGIVVPVLRDGTEYIDGGVCDPLPVRLARETWNLDFVIAVNVLPPVGSLRKRRRFSGKSGFWMRLFRTLNQHVNYFARGNLLDILRGAAMGSQMRLVHRSANQADVLISAMSPKTGWHDYHRYREYIEVGREAATRALPELKALFATGGSTSAKPKEETEVLRCA